jgi:hypothetical protein
MFAKLVPIDTVTLPRGNIIMFDRIVDKWLFFKQTITKKNPKKCKQQYQKHTFPILFERWRQRCKRRLGDNCSLRFDRQSLLPVFDWHPAQPKALPARFVEHLAPIDHSQRMQETNTQSSTFFRQKAFGEFGSRGK